MTNSDNATMTAGKSMDRPSMDGYSISPTPVAQDLLTKTIITTI